jgi:hypothetical protein
MDHREFSRTGLRVSTFEMNLLDMYLVDESHPTTPLEETPDEMKSCGTTGNVSRMGAIVVGQKG